MAYYNTADGDVVPTDVRNKRTVYAKGQLVTGTARIYVEDRTLYVPQGWLTVHVRGS